MRQYQVLAGHEDMRHPGPPGRQDLRLVVEVVKRQTQFGQARVVRPNGHLERVRQGLARLDLFERQQGLEARPAAHG
jgi:hypothetical protein